LDGRFKGELFDIVQYNIVVVIETNWHERVSSRLGWAASITVVNARGSKSNPGLDKSDTQLQVACHHFNINANNFVDSAVYRARVHASA